MNKELRLRALRQLSNMEKQGQSFKVATTKGKIRLFIKDTEEPSCKIGNVTIITPSKDLLDEMAEKFVAYKNRKDKAT